MKILFIGNSYTYYNEMPALFEGLAVDNQKDVSVYSVTAGSRKLIDYMDPTDKTTMALDTLLTKHTFDICFIQEQSLLPAADFNRFIEGLDCVVTKLKNRVDTLILYATWGRKQGSEALITYNWTNQSMTELLADAYQTAAKRYDARVSPVGLRFLNITQTYPEVNLYNEDQSHPSYQGSCLAALTHYYTLFGNFPKNTDRLSLSNEELIAFQSVVCK